MTRGSTIIWGKDDMTRAPAPDAEHTRREFNSASAQSGTNTPSGLCGTLRSQGLAAGKMTLQNYPMVDLSVGQRGGRLTEISPARHHRAVETEHLSVQGDRPSHSFFPSITEIVTAFGVVFAMLVLLFVHL